MREKFVIIVASGLIAFLAMTVCGTLAFAGSLSQGSTANRQFTVQGKPVLNGLWGLSYAPSGQSKRRLTFPLAYRGSWIRPVDLADGGGCLRWRVVLHQTNLEFPGQTGEKVVQETLTCHPSESSRYRTF